MIVAKSGTREKEIGGETSDQEIMVTAAGKVRVHLGETPVGLARMVRGMVGVEMMDMQVEEIRGEEENIHSRIGRRNELATGQSTRWQRQARWVSADAPVAPYPGS